MFDLDQARRNSGLRSDIIARVEAAVRKDFPDDEMMFELHLIRTLQALKEGKITLDQVLAETVAA